MTEQGYLHRKSDTFGKVMEPLMHDKTVTDGAVRLYAHMHWRYGLNQKDWEGRKSMSDELGVTPRTITSRLGELAARDWIMIVERSGDTNFYHIFEDQDDCRLWKKAHPGKILPGGVEDNFQGGWKNSSTNTDSSITDSTKNQNRVSPSANPPRAPRRTVPATIHSSREAPADDKAAPMMSNLGAKLLGVVAGSKLTKRHKHLLDIPVVTGGTSKPSPNEMFEGAASFRAWLDGVLLPYFSALGEGGQAGLSHLINLMRASYTRGKDNYADYRTWYEQQRQQPTGSAVPAADIQIAPPTERDTRSMDDVLREFGIDPDEEDYE